MIILSKSNCLDSAIVIIVGENKWELGGSGGMRRGQRLCFRLGGDWLQQLEFQ